MDIRVLLTLLAAHLLIFRPATAQDATQGFSIAGTVVNTQTGAPVRQALVTLRRQGQFPRIALPALSDSTGRFQFNGLAPGNYNILGAKPGFQADPDLPGTIELGPSRDRLDIRLIPNATVAGRVTDSRGKPLSGISVLLVQTEITEGRKFFRQWRPRTTDDLGQYRFWNVPPGEYLIQAAGRGGETLVYMGQNVPRIGGLEGFAPIYFGGGQSRRTATPVVLTPAQELNADLSVTMRTAYRVRGTLRNLAGYRNVKVELLRDGQDPSASPASVNATSGRFEIRGVVPGSYLLRASQGEDTDMVRAEREIQVSESDLDGLVLELSPAVTISGEITGATRDPANPRIVRKCDIQLTSDDANQEADVHSSIDTPDGKLAIESVPPGKYWVDIRTWNAYVLSARWGSQDLLVDPHINVEAGAVPAPITISLATDGGRVKGTAPNGVVILAPIGSGLVLNSPVLDGKFQFVQVAPGDYKAYLFKDDRSVEYMNPDVRRLLRGGQDVHVVSGGTFELEWKAVSQ